MRIKNNHLAWSLFSRKWALCGLLLLLARLGWAQLPPTFVWANKIGGAQEDFGRAVTTDALGNVYETGFFRDTVDLDPGVGGTMGYGNPQRMFIRKFDPSGNMLWVADIGSNSLGGWLLPNDITTDAWGNVYIFGTFWGNQWIDFDPGPGTYPLLNWFPATDAILLKLRPSGAFAWAIPIGLYLIEDGMSVVTDAQGSVYAVGAFTGGADFDPGPAIVPAIGHGDSTDAFICKYDSAGNFKWVRETGGWNSNDYAMDLAPGPGGSVYLTGHFAGTVDLDMGPGVQNVTAVGSKDIFVEKLDSLGNLLWYRTYGGPLIDVPTSIAVDYSGAAYLGGIFTGTATIGGQSLTSNNVSQDIWLMKLDAAGNTVWVRTIGSSVNDLVMDIALDAASNVHSVGFFGGVADFDPGPGSAIRSAEGPRDYYILKMNANGDYRWVGTGGSHDNDMARGIAISASNRIYVTGQFADTVDLDPTATIFLANSAQGSPDQFLMALQSCTPTDTTLAFTACDSVTYQGVSYTQSGTYQAILLNQAGCDSIVTLNLTVNHPPALPGVITGPNNFCPGTVVTYSISPVPGATSYTWVLPGGWVGTSSTTSITATASASSGNVTVTAINACGASLPQSLAITVVNAPDPNGPITGPSPVCDFSTHTYSISPVPGATSYLWTVPGTINGPANGTSVSVTFSSSGTILVRGMNSCGIAPKGVTLAVNTQPNPTASFTVSINNLTATVTNQSSFAWNAVWSFGDGDTSYLWQPGPHTYASSGTYTICLTVSDNLCSATYCQTVSAFAPPPQPDAIVGDSIVCSNSSRNYSVPPVPGATNYNWTFPSGWSGATNSNSVTVLTGTVGGTISVVASNSAGPSPARTMQVQVNLPPAQPGAITGMDSLCTGSTETYSILPVPDAVDYGWTLPGGWTGSSTTDSITATAGSSGTISVVATNACGSSSPSNLAVTVLSPPSQPGAISGLGSVCEGINAIYSVGAVPGATSYAWSAPALWIGGGSSNVATYFISPPGGTLSVTASNACGTSPAQSMNVTVTARPVLNGNISGPSPICEGSIHQYSIPPATGATSYFWMLPAGWSGSSNSTSITATAGGGGGSVEVNATNQCGQAYWPLTLGVNVQPIPNTGFTFSTNALTATFTNTSQFAWNWHWDFGDGDTSNVFQPVHTYAAPGTYNVCLTARDNLCPNTKCHFVTVVPVGVVPALADVVTVSPNPSAGLFRVNSSRAIAVQVIDATGRLVQELDLQRGQSVLDLRSVAAGVYALVARDWSGALRLVKAE